MAAVDHVLGDPRWGRVPIVTKTRWKAIRLVLGQRHVGIDAGANASQIAFASAPWLRPFGRHVTAIDKQPGGADPGPGARPEIRGEQAEAALAPKVDLPQAISRGVEALQQEDGRVRYPRRICADAPALSIRISAGSARPGTTMCSVVSLVMAASGVVAGDDRAVGARREQRALDAADLGGQGAARVERAARGMTGRARQIALQHDAIFDRCRTGSASGTADMSARV